MADGRTVGRTRVRPKQLLRLRRTVRITVVVYLLAIVTAIVAIVSNHGASVGGVVSNLLSLAVITAVVAYGQTLVILVGGLDLSIPWVMTLGGVFLTSFSLGDNTRGAWALAVILAAGAGIGMVNGLGVILLRIPAVVMTLAMNVILQGFVLVYTNGSPEGNAPSFLTTVMSQRGPGGIPNDVWFLLAFTFVGVLLLRGTTYGRKVYAVGGSDLAARLSGIHPARIIVSVYIVSGFCAALGGALLVGFSQQSYLGMGDEYLLPSIAAVVIGGASVTGGRGEYLGTLGAVLFLTAIGFNLSGPSSDAVKTIIFGIVVLVTALLFNRSRSRV